MTTGERFGLFVDVDLPSDETAYKQFRRRSDRGAIYVTNEQGNVQVWLNGTPSTLRLLAQKLTSTAEDVEVQMTAQQESE